LNSERAIAVNIAIMRAFVQLRTILATHTDILSRVDTLEEEQLRESFRLEMSAGCKRSQSFVGNAAETSNADYLHRSPCQKGERRIAQEVARRPEIVD
jgi:hypothetical protein